jgi:hypothetical protein
VVLLIVGTVLSVYGIRVLRRPRDRADDRG